MNECYASASLLAAFPVGRLGILHSNSTTNILPSYVFWASYFHACLYFLHSFFGLQSYSVTSFMDSSRSFGWDPRKSVN